ncbi:MAG: HEPN domain-containing protein [Solirubrobacteraceae bacterium]
MNPSLHRCPRPAEPRKSRAVEKATKAVLVLAGVPLPHIHDLERLLSLSADAGWPPPPEVADAGWLTPWGVQFRYDEVIEALDEPAALAAADAAVRWALETSNNI